MWQVLTGGMLFFFTCAMYGLYKWTRLDVDYVFSRGGDASDYMVDVEGLRQNATASSSLTEWEELVARNGGVIIAYIVDDCLEPSAVYGVGYLVRGPYDSLQAVVQVNYTSDREIDESESEALVFVQFGDLVMLDQKMSVCQLDPEVVNCPIPKGFRSYYRKQQLPKYAPRGQYRARVELRLKDTKEVKICAKGHLRI